MFPENYIFSKLVMSWL